MSKTKFRPVVNSKSVMKVVTKKPMTCFENWSETTIPAPRLYKSSLDSLKAKTS
jgi:hypothetical protein